MHPASPQGSVHLVPFVTEPGSAFWFLIRRSYLGTLFASQPKSYLRPLNLLHLLSANFDSPHVLKVSG